MEEKEKRKEKTDPFIAALEKTGIRIATFNIENFGRAKCFKSDSADKFNCLDAVAKIIIDNDIDIIAIQEILHWESLMYLVERLANSRARHLEINRKDSKYKNKSSPGLYSTQTMETCGFVAGDWEGRWAKPETSKRDTNIWRTEQIAEGYAFIWNTDRIELTKNYLGKCFEPRIGYYTKSKALVRPPLIGRFSPKKGAKYEIRLINTHIAWEKPDKEPSAVKNAYKATSDDDREKELQILLENVYYHWDKKQYDVMHNDPNAKLLAAYTFLLGDYNLNLPGANGKSAKMNSRFEKYEIDGLRIATVNGALTTLSKPPTDAEKLKEWRKSPNPQSFLANNYDHFSYNEKKYTENGIQFPNVTTVKAYNIFQNRKSVSDPEATKYEMYKHIVSDHLPVILDLDIRKKRNGG